MSIEGALKAVRNSTLLRELPVWSKVRALYDTSLRVWTLNRGLSREIYPGMLFNCSYASRHAISVDIQEQNFDLPAMHYIRKYMSLYPESVFLDCGANHGQYAMVVDRWVGDTGRVFAFEPHPQTVDILGENIRRNGCRHIEVLPMAVGEELGTLELYGPAGLGTTFTLFNEGGEGSHPLMSVPVNTLDAFCTERGISPTCIKVDVEGFEFSVLKGAAQVLRQGRSTIKIICEMHTFMWETPDYDLQIISFIKSLGLRLFTMGGEEADRIKEYGHYVIAEKFD